MITYLNRAGNNQEGVRVLLKTPHNQDSHGYPHRSHYTHDTKISNYIPEEHDLIGVF